MKFYQAFQDDTETFVQFVSRVRKLATKCDFKEKEEQIRDRLVIGKKKKKMQEKLIVKGEFSLHAIIEKVRFHE